MEHVDVDAGVVEQLCPPKTVSRRCRTMPGRYMARCGLMRQSARASSKLEVEVFRGNSTADCSRRPSSRLSRALSQPDVSGDRVTHRRADTVAPQHRSSYVSCATASTIRLLSRGTMRKLALLLLTIPTLARAQDVARGEAMAKRWCANCHVVTRSATVGSANGAQTFPALARDPQITESKLRAAMTSQHGGRMPDFSLTKQEQDDLVAYIFSLRTK